MDDDDQNEDSLGSYVSEAEQAERAEEVANFEDEDQWDADVRMERTEGIDLEDSPRAVVEEDVFGDGYYEDEITDPTCLEVITDTFEELRLPPEQIAKVQGGFAQLVQNAGSPEAAGEAVYSTLFEAAPSLQSLWTTPRAVQGMKFANSLALLISKLSYPEEFKNLVDTLGFQHLTTEVTVPRIEVFRDALLELFAADLGDLFTMDVRIALCRMFNYIGGAFIYIRNNYSSRLKLISQCWTLANSQRNEMDEEPEETQESSEHNLENKEEEDGKKGKSNFLTVKKTAREETSQEVSMEEGHSKKSSARQSLTSNKVPTTFPEMFKFNASVMGYKQHEWMGEVLQVFDNMVLNCGVPSRLLEEADILSLSLAKLHGKIDLLEFKAVMLASLRSLLPKTWNSECEVAWTWLWENIQKMLKANMGKPAVQQKALRKFFMNIEDQQLAAYRTALYTAFFAKCAQGQDYFKQSSTRLHFIADRMLMYTQDVFKDPKGVMESLSALGLRHVGYGIPTELFGPFVSSAIECFRGMTKDEQQEEAFRWSLNLISRVLVRTITEGSTLVMRAINANCAKMLRKAVSCAPRGLRAEWMLRVQVGTQSISPLLWSIESGSLEAAQAILLDLLTIRADRDHYYYAMDALFNRHPDIIQRIGEDGPELLPTLLDGLIWRSRNTSDGTRRVNYFIKYLVVDPKDGFSQSFRDVVAHGDPTIACHPAVVLAADILWSHVVAYTFLMSKLWFLLNLVVFVVTMAIITDYSESASSVSLLGMFIGRLFIYVFGFGQLVLRHLVRIVRACRKREVRRVCCLPIPSYLIHFSESLSGMLCISLGGMLCQEPVLHCLGKRALSDVQFAQFGGQCAEAAALVPSYSSFAFVATLLYFLLLLDLTVFSTKLSTFVLVCGRMVQEIAQYLFALSFVVLTFACGLASSDVANEHFSEVLPAMLSLSRIMLGMFSSEEFQHLEEEPKLLLSVSVFVICTTIFLLNLLIAQLNCAYFGIFKDMLGFARLNRGSVILDNIPHVSPKRWKTFVDSLKMDEKLEFSEGDIGIAGGLQVLEPASANPVTTDSIKRYGGSTSRECQWPETATDLDSEDKIDRLERVIDKAVKKIIKGTKAKGSTMGSSSSSGMTSSSMGDSSHEN